MASLKEYFGLDFKRMYIKRELMFEERDESTGKTIKKISVVSKCLIDHSLSIRAFIYYLEETQNPGGVIEAIIESYENEQKITEGLTVKSDRDDQASLGSHVQLYSRVIYFYSESELDTLSLRRINTISKQKQLNVIIRDKKYMESRNKLSRPVAFISHDSKDKDKIARVIAEKLSSRLCSVWYDEYSLGVGDSLRHNIEKGIKEAKKCILVLTPNFLSNEGWGKKEFDSVFTREMILEERIVLPVWSGVTAKEIYEYSPSLADTFALQWPDSNSISNETEFNKAIELCISKLHTAVTK
jgi:hypothetical protein